ncbi:MAG: hypothetical protein H7256_03825 [Bdellovibrio sp.]|nr:hypothetical protein [Bdellovibrio sp.]
MGTPLRVRGDSGASIQYDDTAGTSKSWSAGILDNTSAFAFIEDRAISVTGGTERMRIAAGGNVGIGTTTPAEALDVSGNVHTSGQTYSNQYVVASGATVDFNNGNLQILQSVGQTAITLNNMKDGGSYVIVITDTAARTYTFTNCTQSKFAPINADTTLNTMSIYNILKMTIASTTYCFISWSSGYQ